MPAHVFGVLMSMEPAIGALVGFVVLGERLGARAVVAIALVVIASAGAAREPDGTRSSRTSRPVIGSPRWP